MKNYRNLDNYENPHSGLFLTNSPFLLKRCSFFLIIVSVILSLTSIVITFFRVDYNITNNEYVSLILGLTAILTAFTVGYQIFNAIEHKEKLNQVEDSIKKINKMQTDIIKELRTERFYNKINKGEEKLNEKNYILSLHFYLEAIKYIIYLPQNYELAEIAFEKLIELNEITENLITQNSDKRSVEGCLIIITDFKKTHFYHTAKVRNVIDELHKKIIKGIKGN